MKNNEKCNCGMIPFIEKSLNGKLYLKCRCGFSASPASDVNTAILNWHTDNVSAKYADDIIASFDDRKKNFLMAIIKDEMSDYNFNESFVSQGEIVVDLVKLMPKIDTFVFNALSGDGIIIPLQSSPDKQLIIMSPLGMLFLYCLAGKKDKFYS